MAHNVILGIDRETRPDYVELYYCVLCDKPVYWDGIFEGAWLHEIEVPE
jgi:hypothetical protein